MLMLLPVASYVPALSGAFSYDPINLVSGLTAGTWHTNGWLAGAPWADANAGVTTQALGTLVAHDWLSDILPYWNPYSGVGMPLAAEGQVPAFFLPFVLLLAVPHGFLALHLVLMVLAGWFAYALMRQLGLGALPAFAGAALFGLNGTFAWLAHGPALPVAFLPLTLLGLEQARQGRFPSAVTAGVAWSFLAGFPETAVLNMLLAAAWGMLRLAQSPARGRYAVNCGLAAAAGLLIAAPAIWPFLDALPRGFTGQHAAGSGSMVAGNLGQALFPALLGNPLAATHAGNARAVWQRAGGYVPLALAAVAAVGLAGPRPERGLRWLLAGFVVVTGARAAGWGPAMWLFGLLPLLRQAAVHTYIWPAWSMIAALLAAYGLQPLRVGPRRFIAVGAAVLAVSVVALWLARPAIANLLAAPPASYHPLRDVALGLLEAAAVLWLLGGATAEWRRIGATAMLCGQAAALVAFWQLAGPHGRTPDFGAVEYLRSHIGLGRVVSFGPLAPNYGAMFGIAEVDYNTLPVPEAWAGALRGRLPVMNNGVALAEGDLPAADALASRIAAYEAFGAAYAVTWPDRNLAAGLPAAARMYRGEVMDIWRLPSPAPYVAAPLCSVQATSRARFALDCMAPSRLLRRELFDPGWRATVNGVASVVTNAGIFQSVSLPAGKSVVRFAYAPPYMFVAWACCAAGFALLLFGRPLLAKPRRLDEDEAAKELP